MKKLLLLLSFIFLNANSFTYVKNILGEDTFNTYYNLIKSSLDENASLKDTLIFLKNNGLINLYFKKIKTIHPTFTFIDKNSIFDTKILYDTLKEMGYYNFYPIKINKNSHYSLTLEMMSQNYIDPLEFLINLNQKGCDLINVKKNQNFSYIIECKKPIINAKKLSNKIQILHNINGIYWVNPEKFSKIYISTSKYDFWHPYIVFYDKNLNILNIISSSDLIRKKILNIPQNCSYIKIADSFTKENIKRGIFIKGLK